MYSKRLETIPGAKALSDAILKKAAKNRRAAKQTTLREKLILQGAIR